MTVSRPPAQLFMVCGKIGCGKSTLAQQLASRHQALLIAEDQWLAILYAGRQNSIAEYIENAQRLRQAIAPQVINLLKMGVSVVLDFPLNTVNLRLWGKNLADSSHCPHQLYYLNQPDEVCLQRLAQRNASGQHPFQTSEQQYFAISAYFVPPSEQEDLNCVEYRADKDE
ncbi:MAG: ATP-binding protein [Rouxiella aceris]|uniref:AAA family ATPase n=1 Tax=Rouxiella aceris TaxID=2703884 RepID=UPI002850B721|nr:ATP-binding protein [Rouxiella aceris]MDR3431915.1 ATP-binding protein [Rouxiella aceris]